MAEVRLGRVAGQVGGQIGSTSVRAIPRSDDSVGHHKRDVVRVRPAATFDSDGDVGKRHIVITNTNFGT